MASVTLVLVWPILGRAADPTFSEAIGLLSQERSYAGSGAALVKHYAPNDIEARRLYADAGLLSTEGSATEVRPAAQFGAMTK